MNKFRAVLKLQGETVKVPCRIRPRDDGHRILVNDETRRKKLDSLIKLMKKQGLTPHIEYQTDEDGLAIAVVTAEGRR